MSAPPENRRMTADEYLAFERASDTKHEFFNGEIIDFAGASVNHTRIIRNMVTLLHTHGRSQGCEVFTADLRVRVGRARAYTYPDIVVACRELRFADDQEDTLVNPTILIEVLSPSTEMTDRGRKFTQYTTLSSLQEYILISQARPQIEQFARQADGSWRYTKITTLDEHLTLPSANCTFNLTDIYEDVQFNPDQLDEDEN
ncbi:MAG: Uma2 family endonuclease [Anaerolineae bacterium]|nr:Uma2 family endonuclease [Anaerolineae bacterium]